MHFRKGAWGLLSAQPLFQFGNAYIYRRAANYAAIYGRTRRVTREHHPPPPALILIKFFPGL